MRDGVYAYRHQQVFDEMVRQNAFYRLDCPGKALDDKAFFGLFGFAAQSCDYQAHDGADFALDLNVRPEGQDREDFDLVLDGGTMEHVFDTASVLQNIHSLLKPGGCVVHINPVNNAAEHGFYQFSPTFYWDYYTANNYEILESKLILRKAEGGLPTFSDYTPEITACSKRDGINRGSAMIFFAARKKPDSTFGVAPTQGVYAHIYANQAAAVPDFTLWKIKNALADLPPEAPAALRCAGAFAKELLARSESLRSRTAFLVDSDPARHCQSVQGRPVISPEEYKAQEAGLRALVVATPNSVGVYERIAGHIAPGMRVILA